MAPRAPTAYFIFAGEIRASVQEDIAATNNGKAPVAMIGKEIGVRWKQLTDEERQRYKDMAAERAKELKEQQAAAAANNDKDVEGDTNVDDEDQAGPSSSTQATLPFGLPPSLIKKIACLDSDVDRISADGLRALTKSASLFIEWLAMKAYTNATNNKRKNFKYSDIELLAHKDRRLVEMGLGELMRDDPVFAQVRAKAEEEEEKKASGAGAGRKRKNDINGEEEKEKQKMKPLTAFFAGAGKNKDGDDEEEEAEILEAEDPALGEGEDEEEVQEENE